MTTPLGLYVHIPFCHARCGYCDFVTFTGKEDRIGAYLRAVHQELALNQPLADGRPVSSIFFGGGTPSLLTGAQVRAFLDTVEAQYAVASGSEVTLEANPESVTFESARRWKDAGINRLSLGLQAMDDTLLKAMGRLHDTAQFLRAYDDVRQAGFKNVSVDLIYGFEGQSFSSWKDTVERAAALGPEHLSLYALTVEEHTPFAATQMKVNIDGQAEMYEWAREALAEKGYSQYEISNFSKPGHECRHNLIYWRQHDYLGVGVGAVGAVGTERWQNHKTLHDYHRGIERGQRPRLSTEKLDAKTRRFESLMLGLRLREGMAWPSDSDAHWLKTRCELAVKGWLEEVRPGQWRIPDSVVGLTNQILLPFL